MSWVANVMVSVESNDHLRVAALSEWLRVEAPARDRDAKGVGFLARMTGADTQWGGWKYPECEVWGGVLNQPDIPAILAHIAEIPWRVPGALQVFVLGQEESFFRLWMLRDGRLQQYAPIEPDEEHPDFYPGR
ncbi:hypothetical protein [Actinocorallia lasiicapitis]